MRLTRILLHGNPFHTCPQGFCTSDEPFVVETRVGGVAPSPTRDPLPRRSLIKEAGIATSLGVVVAASVISMTPSTQSATTQVAYFGWYQMHAKVQSNKIKEYYEQNPTTGEEIGQ